MTFVTQYRLAKEIGVPAQRISEIVAGRRAITADTDLRLLHNDGWFLVATCGSHRQFKHLAKPGRVTVAGRPGTDLAPGTLNSILKQAGLRRN